MEKEREILEKAKDELGRWAKKISLNFSRSQRRGVNVPVLFVIYLPMEDSNTILKVFFLHACLSQVLDGFIATHTPSELLPALLVDLGDPEWCQE